MKNFYLKGAYITLGQFLKANDYINSGGEAKVFLLNNDIKVNNEKCQERGKKIHKGIILKINNDLYEIR